MPGAWPWALLHTSSRSLLYPWMSCTWKPCTRTHGSHIPLVHYDLDLPEVVLRLNSDYVMGLFGGASVWQYSLAAKRGQRGDERRSGTCVCALHAACLRCRGGQQQHHHLMHGRELAFRLNCPGQLVGCRLLVMGWLA
jgi:hypothetical protein